MNWEYHLIETYLFVCYHYEQDLWAIVERMSNNSNPDFTDEEVITIYLFGIMKKRFTLKEIYEYTRDHLGDWFPDLPGYEAYVQRINKLSDIFPYLLEKILSQALMNCPYPLLNALLLDSMPIMLAKGRRSSSAKVAKEFANKGFCSSKNIWYHGVKVHIVGTKRDKKLPLPDYIGLSPAKDHDLKAFLELAPHLEGKELFADKAYWDQVLKKVMKLEQGTLLNTPIKREKGQEFLNSFERLISTAVSKIRQPIESLFNWINEKTGIQIASKVRSYNGLMVHVFGKLTAAMYLLANKYA
jgi:hypothetical protein